MNRALNIFLWLILAFPLCLSQSVLPASIDSLILQGTDAVLRDRYEDAEKAFREAARREPRHPAGVVFLAGLLHQRAEDLSEPFDRRSFDSLLTEAEVRAKLSESQVPSDALIPTLRATAWGMLAVVESGSGEWMSAVRDALASSSAAQEAWEADSSVADVGLPLGNYLYWRSRKTEALNWLPLFSDDRSEGIRRLEFCAREGRYHRFAAVTSLIWILHDSKEDDRAESWARTGLTAYPQNRTFLAGLAMVQESNGQGHLAAEAWGRVAASLESVGAGRSYAMFSARVNQVRCLLLANDSVQARRVANAVTEPPIPSVPEALRHRYKAKRAEWTSLEQKLAVVSQIQQGSSSLR